MVGWGAFVMPGTTFLPVAGVAGTILALLIGTLVMLVIGTSTSYLMSRSPGTGGMYSYTKEVYGRDHAFLCSWFLCLSYLSIVFLNGSALFVVIRTILGDRTQTGFYYMISGNAIYLNEIITSVMALAGIGILFIVAKPILQRLHTFFALTLAAGVILTTFLCLPRIFSADVLHSMSQGAPASGAGFGIFSLVILAPWAFVGFEVTSFETSHFKFPVKKAGRITILSILFAGFAYIAMSVVSAASWPDGYHSWADYIQDLGKLGGVEAVPTFYVAKSLIGPFGLAVITITALAAILTGIIGAYRATVRVLSTMAEDQILSEKFSKTTYSILFIMLLSILISLLGRNTLIWFVDLTSFGAIVAYGYTSAAAYRIAKSENNRTIMKIGLVGAVISVCFAIVQLVPHLSAMEAMGSEAFLLLSLWCLLGFVFYRRTIQRSTLTEYSGLSTSGTVLFALLVYAALMGLAKLLFSKDSIEEIRTVLVVGVLAVLIIIFIGLAVMLYIQDIVRIKHEAAEREKIRAVEGSLAKSQFLFNMSHDIRTPMNAIIGYTNLARKEDSVEAMRGYLDKISLSGQHLLSLINDILEMSRIENGKTELSYEPSDLRQVFDEIGELFRDQMEQKGLNFSIHYTQVQHPLVWCDPKNLNRVLLNLISNAYKFTPAGGTITAILVEAGSEENRYGTYEIRIQDSGIGMSREFVDKMFTAFERERTSTDSGMQGTGLGLTIVKNLIDLMGGTIEVLTTPGSGTQFIIRLKLQLAQEKNFPVEEDTSLLEEDTTAAFADKRLLLVEDNLINMEIAKMILSQEGFQVETAENGKEALDMVSASAPGYYNAILMDIQMPVMDGYEATRAIRSLDNRELAQIPIIAMTANAFQEDVQAAMDSGMQAHIAKPIDIPLLKKELLTVLKD